MGKLHRIKRRFKKVTIKPIKEGYYSLGNVSISIGKRYDGSIYITNRGWTRYNKFLSKLIKKFEMTG